MPRAARDLADLQPHLFAQRRIEVRQRLIEQQDRRPVDDRAREPDPLLLAAGKFARIALGQRREMHHAQRLGDPFALLRFRHAAHLEREADVGGDGQVREQRETLEHHAHVAPVGRHARQVAAIDDDAAAVRRQGAGDDAQQRRLAAAARAQQREEHAARHAQRDIVERNQPSKALPMCSSASRTSVMRLSALRAGFPGSPSAACR